MKPHIIIDKDGKIIVPKELKNLAIQYERNVKTITFDCPRYTWDGQDMTEMALYVNIENGQNDPIPLPCKNVRLDENDPDMMHFDWTITREATLEKGKIAFSVCAKETDNEGILDCHWSSQICEEANILPGMDCYGALAEQYPDLATWMLTRLDLLEGNSVFDDKFEPRTDDIPKVYFEGDITGMSKEDSKMLAFAYISNSMQISGFADVKWQGSTSINYPKKNFTIKLYADSAKTEKLKLNMKGWGEKSRFCLKANWIDLSHARNIVSARLWSDVVRSRNNFEELPEELRTSPNLGAVDGFPILVFVNGIYQGRYTWNIPKDAWMVNMDDKLNTHCILQGENAISGCFREYTNIAGGGWNGDGWADELHDVAPENIITRWNEVIGFVMNSTDEEFKNNLSEYFDVDSLIDYLLFAFVDCGIDAFAKNQIYLTYDGNKWIASMYDMDTTWGLYWDGSKLLKADYSLEEYEAFIQGQGNLLYIRLMNLFKSELKARYDQLRQGPLSMTNILDKFQRFTAIYSNDLIRDDYAPTTANGAYVDMPLQDANNIQQIRNYVAARIAYCDAYVASFASDVLELSKLSKFDFANGYDFDMSNGEIVEANTNKDVTRKLVRVDGGSTIYVSVSGLNHPSLPYGAIAIAEYGENGEFIEYTENPQPDMSDFTAYFTLKENTNYIRIRVNFLSTASTLYAGKAE